MVRFWCPIAKMKATDKPLHMLLDLNKNIYFSKSYSRKLFVIKKTQLDFQKNIFKKLFKNNKNFDFWKNHFFDFFEKSMKIENFKILKNRNFEFLKRFCGQKNSTLFSENIFRKKSQSLVFRKSLFRKFLWKLYKNRKFHNFEKPIFSIFWKVVLKIFFWKSSWVFLVTKSFRL